MYNHGLVLWMQKYPTQSSISLLIVVSIDQNIYPEHQPMIVHVLNCGKLTLPVHLSSPPVFSGVRVTPALFLYVCFVDRCCPLVFFLLAIVLSVLLRHTDSDPNNFQLHCHFLNVIPEEKKCNFGEEFAPARWFQ
jgi:hypothetical protein